MSVKLIKYQRADQVVYIRAVFLYVLFEVFCYIVSGGGVDKVSRTDLDCARSAYHKFENVGIGRYSAQAYYRYLYRVDRCGVADDVRHRH